MERKWFTPQELAEIEGVTSHAINRRAKQENWKRQKRKGVQGKAHEFHIQHLTPEQRKKLLLKEHPAAWIADPQDPQSLWAATWQNLSEQEKQLLAMFIIRHGAQRLIHLIKENS